MDKAEIWKPITSFGGRYEISNLGRIRNTHTLKVLKNYISPHGYICNELRYIGEKKGKTVRVHRLIADAFIPNPNNYPIINHIDGNKLNNDISNLEWCTYQHNSQHSFANGLQKPNGRILVKEDYVKIFAMYKNGYRYSEMTRALNNRVVKRTIYYVLKRKSYLEWYTEDEFQNEVENLRTSLQVKEVYKNHKRIQF